MTKSFAHDHRRQCTSTVNDALVVWRFEAKVAINENVHHDRLFDDTTVTKCTDFDTETCILERKVKYGMLFISLT